MSRASVSQRQIVLDRYHSPEGQRESGISHLWHLERLARARLGPSRGIVDAEDIDFRDPDFVTDDHLYTLAFSLDRQERRREVEAAALRSANLAVMNRLVRATDEDERRRRHLNLFPQSATETVEMERLTDQHLQRQRDRERRSKQIGRENEKLLRRLHCARSDLPQTAQLDAWYRNTHSKRMCDLSHFKKAETFAGARVLESECGVRLPPSVTTRDRNQRTSAATSRGMSARAPFSADGSETQLYLPLDDTRPPLLEGQPYPPLMVSDVLPWVPAALQPPHEGTHYGSSMRRSPMATLQDHDTYAINNTQRTVNRATKDGENAHTPRTRLLREVRPPWQPVTALDLPLFHYTQDLALRPRTDPLVRCASEEGGCTALWRRTVRHQRETYEAQLRAEKLALSTLCARQESQRGALRERVRQGSRLLSTAPSSAPTEPTTRRRTARPPTDPSWTRPADDAGPPTLQLTPPVPQALAPSKSTTHSVANRTTPGVSPPHSHEVTLAENPHARSSSSASQNRPAVPESLETNDNDNNEFPTLLARWRSALETSDCAPYVPI